MSDYNEKNCDERHAHIDNWCQNMETKIRKVENRFLALISMLSLNLVGVIVTLIVLLLNK